MEIPDKDSLIKQMASIKEVDSLKTGYDQAVRMNRMLKSDLRRCLNMLTSKYDDVTTLYLDIRYYENIYQKEIKPMLENNQKNLKKYHE